MDATYNKPCITTGTKYPISYGTGYTQLLRDSRFHVRPKQRKKRWWRPPPVGRWRTLRKIVGRDGYSFVCKSPRNGVHIPDGGLPSRQQRVHTSMHDTTEKETSIECALIQSANASLQRPTTR